MGGKWVLVRAEFTRSTVWLSGRNQFIPGHSAAMAQGELRRKRMCEEKGEKKRGCCSRKEGDLKVKGTGTNGNFARVLLANKDEYLNT
jgi:hypothetical protein